MALLAYSSDGPALAATISPRREIGAYEALWLEQGATFKTLADRFSKDPTALPSDMVSRSAAETCANEVLSIFAKAGVTRFGVRINHAGDYPKKLRDARHPVLHRLVHGPALRRLHRVAAGARRLRSLHDRIERPRRSHRSHLRAPVIATGQRHRVSAWL